MDKGILKAGDIVRKILSPGSVDEEGIPKNMKIAKEMQRTYTVVEVYETGYAKLKDKVGLTHSIPVSKLELV